MQTAFVRFGDLPLPHYAERSFFEFEGQAARLFLQFLFVLLLELEVGLVGGAFVIAEEASQIDLIKGIPVRMVGSAGKGGVERAIGADEVEVHAVEVCADGVEVFAAIGEGTFELHAGLLLTKSTVFGHNLVVHYPLQDVVVNVPVFELDLVVFYLYKVE